MNVALRFEFVPALALLLLAFLLPFQAIEAHVSRDSVMEVTATTSSVSPYITFTWTGKSTYATTIYRRVKGATTWESPVTVAAGIYTYADMTAFPGIAYEYAMMSTSRDSTSGIVAGYNVPLVESRGKVILLVDNSMATALAPEINQLKKNLSADGWTVLRHDVPRETVAPNNNQSTAWSARIAEQQAVRSIVQADYNLAPDSNWALFILGRVPVPYTGQMAFDGHGGHSGAWSCDSYYADVDGVWTDSTIDTSKSSTYLPDGRNINLPGDGKFDHYLLPSNVELQCGRVDLSNMPSIPTGMTETELLRQYLVRDNNFRRVQAPYNNIARRGIVDDNFGYYGESGWSSGFDFFGRNSGQMDASDWFTTLSTTPMLFAYGSGSGTFTSADGVGDSQVRFGKTDSKAVFTQLFGSWFGDWDCTDNFLRAPLAGTSNSLGLACSWSGSFAVAIPLYHMALGDPIGYCVRKATNSRDWKENYTGETCVELMGDPTLRLHSIAPPLKVTATSAAGGITVNWQPSPDTTLSGYHLYRSTSVAGPFTRITGTAADGSNPTGSCLSVSTLTFTDTDSALVAGTSYTYLVKAVRMEVSASGTYANQSVGEGCTLAHLSAMPTPLAPTRLVVTRTAHYACRLDWDDNSADETGFQVERRNPSTGAWSLIGTTAANVTSYNDNGASVGQITHYRVRAANTSNSTYSNYSNEAADYNRPGLAYTTSYSYVFSKTEAVAAVPIIRFNGSTGAVRTNYSTTDIMSAACTDYQATNASVSWDHGEMGAKKTSIPINNLSGNQLSKIFKVTLATPLNGLAYCTPTTSYVFINDPDSLSLPSPWSTAVMGIVGNGQGGYSEYAGGSFGIAFCGGPINSWQGDSYRLIYQTVVGDFQLTARLTTLGTTLSSSILSGVFVRSSLADSGAAGAAILRSSSTNATYVYRGSNGGSNNMATTASGLTIPGWIRLARAGNNISSYTSSDGLTWAAVTTSNAISGLGTSAYVGLALSSGNANSSDAVFGPQAYARFDNVSLVTTNYQPVGNISTFTATPGANAGEITLSWSAAANAATYQIERSTLSNSGFLKINSVEQPALTYTDTGLTTNTTYYYRVMALNPAYSSAYAATVSAQPYLPSNIDGWRYTNFGNSTVDPGYSGDLDTPSYDGITNLMKYVLGVAVMDQNLNPVYAYPTCLPVIQKQTIGVDQYLTCTFTHNKASTDVTILVEVTGDLANGPWKTIDPLDSLNQVSVVDNTPSVGSETIVVKDSQPITASSARFMRFKITH